MSNQVSPDPSNPEECSDRRGSNETRTQAWNPGNVVPPAVYISPKRKKTTKIVETKQLDENTRSHSDSEYPSKSFSTRCVRCDQTVNTVTKREMGTLAWKLCCCMTFVLLCCLTPCCTSFKDVVHYCPQCNMELGRRDLYKIGLANQENGHTSSKQ